MKTVLGVVLLLLSIATAWADEEPRGAHWLLAKYDLNGDTQITPDEIAAKKLALFEAMDADADGDLSFGEYQDMDAAKRRAFLRTRFDKLDTDRDGRISEAEYSSYMGLFSSIDADGDGTLSAAEVGAQPPEPVYVTHCLWVLCIRREAE